jgi:hypothetical protein
MTVWTEAVLLDFEEALKAYRRETPRAPSEDRKMALCALYLVDEVRRLWARERQLLEANNVELEKRRAAEQRAQFLLNAKDNWRDRALAAEQSVDAVYQELLRVKDSLQDLQTGMEEFKAAALALAGKEQQRRRASITAIQATRTTGQPRATGRARRWAPAMTGWHCSTRRRYSGSSRPRLRWRLRSIGRRRPSRSWPCGRRSWRRRGRCAAGCAG